MHHGRAKRIGKNEVNTVDGLDINTAVDSTVFITSIDRRRDRVRRPFLVPLYSKLSFLKDALQHA
jgi:hypothetical protein